MMNNDARTIVSANVHFRTTGQGKDGDSQVRDRITKGGQDFFQLFCCSSGNHGDDVWEPNTDNTRSMTAITPLTVDELATCTFVAGLTATGDDTWSAIYTLQLTLSDGSTMSYSMGELWLYSHDGGLNEKDVILAKLTPIFPQPSS